MNKIILFDGDCNFCNNSVNFIIKQDKKGKFQFASQQSSLGKELKRKFAIAKEEDSLLLIDQDQAYLKSTAALKIAKDLDGFWRAFYFLIIVPAPIRNFAYSIFAKNRYKWFGKQESCKLHPAHIQKRFLT